jgi:hypothetical protein
MTHARPPNSLANPSVRIFIAVLLAGGLPLIGQFLGLRFMPSPDYLDMINIPALAFVSVLAFFVARGLMIYELKNASTQRSDWRKRLVFVPIALLVMTTGYLSVAVTLPMAMTILNSRPAEQILVAGKQPVGLQRGCSGKVNLAYPHILYNSLCKVPAETRASIKQGNSLRLTGKGNWAGIFYDTVTLKR